MNVKIASFNVKNLYMKEGEATHHPPRKKSERSLEAIAESIERLDADVVSLQELFSKETLEDHVLSRRGLAEKYPHVAYVRGNDKRGIQVGVLSKTPFTSVESHKDDRFPYADGTKGQTKFSRDALTVGVNLDDDPEPEVIVLNTHSKSRRPSKSGPSSDSQRGAEGAQLRKIAEEEMAANPGVLTVITGDLNDNTDDASVQEILNPGGGKEQWLDSLDHLPENERNTWPVFPRANDRFGPEQFDHIIYAPEFDGQLVESNPVRFEQSLDTDTKWVSSAASDHKPVYAEFEIAN